MLKIENMSVKAPRENPDIIEEETNHEKEIIEIERKLMAMECGDIKDDTTRREAELKWVKKYGDEFRRLVRTPEIMELICQGRKEEAITKIKIELAERKKAA